MDKLNYLIGQFNKYNIDLNNEQASKLVKFYEMLVETNKFMNLTSITEWEDVVIKHFVDSCLPYLHFRQNSTIIDIGAGAGFPSIPLKVVRPDLKITMLDSLQKRVNFLNKAIIELQLQNINALHSRCEDYAFVSRETFDYSIARAVADLPVLCEYCLPFVKLGGQMVAYKGNVLDELNRSNYAIEVLGGKFNKIINYNLENQNRDVVIIDKIKNTPTKYPRGKNKPRLNPLIK